VTATENKAGYANIPTSSTAKGKTFLSKSSIQFYIGYSFLHYGYLSALVDDDLFHFTYVDDDTVIN
jgi:hypothetical protein